MYWCDSEQRLAEMAGEVHFSPQMSTEMMQEMVRADVLGANASAASAAAAAAAQAQARRRTAPSANPGMMPTPRSALGLEMRPMHTLAQGEARIEEEGTEGEKVQNSSMIVPVIALEERGRLARWMATLSAIPSCWLG